MAKSTSNGATDRTVAESIRAAFDRTTSRVYPLVDLGRLAKDAGWGSRPFGPWSLKMLPYTTRFAHGSITFVDGRSMAMTFTRGPLEDLPTNLVGKIMQSHGKGQRWIDLSPQVRVREDGQVFAIRTREVMDQLVVMHRSFAMLWAEAISEAEAIREGMAMPMERELVCNDCRPPAMRPGANGSPLAEHGPASFGAGGATAGLGSGLPGLMAKLDEKLAAGTAGTDGPGLDTGSLSLEDWASGRDSGGGKPGLGLGMVSFKGEKVIPGVATTAMAANATVTSVGASWTWASLTGTTVAVSQIPVIPAAVGVLGVYLLASHAVEGTKAASFFGDLVADLMYGKDTPVETGPSKPPPRGGDKTQPPPSEEPKKEPIEEQKKTDTDTKSSEETTTDDAAANDDTDTQESKPKSDHTGVPIDDVGEWDGPESLAGMERKAFFAFYFALKMNAKAGELVQYGHGEGADPGDFPEPFRVQPNDGDREGFTAAELKWLKDTVTKMGRRKIGELVQ